jgi:hypothetical protein
LTAITLPLCLHWQSLSRLGAYSLHAFLPLPIQAIVELLEADPAQTIILQAVDSDTLNGDGKAARCRPTGGA